jgi:Capsule assembly protein Wzi
MRTKILLVFILVTLATGRSLTAQIIWEDSRSMIYPFLERMADKGMIDLNDVVRPISQLQIIGCLQSLQKKSTQLSALEQKELDFFWREYQSPMDYVDSVNQRVRILKKDINQRWRGITTGNNKFYLQLDPVTGAKFIEGTHETVTQFGSGIDLKGFAGKRLSFQFNWRDISETGKGIDFAKTATAETGMVRKDNSLNSSLNYSNFKGSIGYQFKNGSISVGQDQLTWGYGNHGRIVLSDKAPAYPFIRLDLHPISWLHFNYAHTWLQSNVIDSSRSNNLGNTVYGGKQLFYQPKFMVIHSIQVIPAKGVSVSIGESIIYNGHLFAPYFIPVMYFKALDNYNSMGDNNQASANSQLFGQVSLRNIVPKAHLYGSLFIDELRLSKIFDKNKRRNQLGYTVGIEKQDFLFANVSVGVEYTRVNPFVYDNFIGAQKYTHATYSLGDWMGNNFDRCTLFFSYKPIARLLFNGRGEWIRKGGAGTLDQQYFAQPQPPFLFDAQWTSAEFFIQARYEMVHHVYLMANYAIRQQSFYTNTPSFINQQTQIGFNFGW